MQRLLLHLMFVGKDNVASRRCSKRDIIFGRREFYVSTQMDGRRFLID